MAQRQTVIGLHESEEVVIENGVPQRAVLSVELFFIAIAKAKLQDDRRVDIYTPVRNTSKTYPKNKIYISIEKT
jgi:hypothetical protein